MNYTTLRKRLSGRLHEDDIHEITFYAQGIEDEPVKSALYTLLFDEDKRIAENAAWIFAHFDLHSNQWLYPRHNELIDEAMRTPSGTKRRLLLGLLLRQPFTENGFRTDFFDFCLRCIVASDEPTAVRCLSVKLACEQCKAAGAKRALPLKVGGAFHSPLMEPARVELSEAIEATVFQAPVCPVYQDVDALPHTDPAEIKTNLIAQLTSPVRWTKIVQNMHADGATRFVEVGPGKALQGMIAKIVKEVEIKGAE